MGVYELSLRKQRNLTASPSRVFYRMPLECYNPGFETQSGRVEEGTNKIFGQRDPQQRLLHANRTALPEPKDSPFTITQ